MNPHSCRPNRQRGFTLIELMVTLTVLGILLGVGVPSFKNFIQNQKVKTAAYDINTAIMIARSEAVKRNTDVTIAPDTADTWTAGWTVKAGATTIVQQQALVAGLAVTKGPSTIVFKSTGRPTAGSNFDGPFGTSVKCVKVDASGIPSTQTAACP
jgi:type IV fimbrial biogenesis protein FimT